MDLFVFNDYNAATRELKAKIRILPSQDIFEDLNLTVMLTQDSIVDAQVVNTDKVPDYIHRHVLRHILTRFDGDPITETMTSGAIIERTLTFTLPADFEAKHCAVIAAVHHNGTPDNAVLQAAEAHIEE